MESCNSRISYSVANLKRCVHFLFCIGKRVFYFVLETTILIYVLGIPSCMNEIVILQAFPLFVTCQKPSVANYQPPECGDLQNNTDIGCSPDPFLPTQRQKEKSGLVTSDYVYTALVL